MENLPSAHEIEKLKRMQMFLSYDPENEKLWIETAQLAISLSEWQYAEELIEKNPESLLNSAEVNALIGQILLAHKRYSDAIDKLLKSISLGIQHTSVWLNLAYCYFYQEQCAEAVDALNSNPELKSEFPEPHALLSARLAYHMDDSDKAVAILNEFHTSHDATAASAGFLSLLLFEDDDTESALNFANVALGKNPHELEALVARSSINLSSGAHELALADMQLAVEYHPQAGRAWSNLAQIEFNNFQFQAAEAAAEKAVSYMPDHIGTWHVLGWSYLMQGITDKALSAFQKSYELDRSFAETHGGLAYTYALMGERDLALDHIKRAEKLDGENFSANFARMALLIKNNEMDKADQYLKNWAGSSNSKLTSTPQELIRQRLDQLERDLKSHKTVH